MKKMTKGAIVTGLGVALLLGGGGTLAVWNDQQVSQAGTISAGNLDLSAHAGTWSSTYNGKITPIDNINSYKIVPGEKLTYTQRVNVIMEGTNLAADLSIDTQGITDTFAANTLKVEKFAVQDPQTKVVMNDVNKRTADVKNGEYLVSATFSFNADGQTSANAKLDLSQAKYVLTQKTKTA